MAKTITENVNKDFPRKLHVPIDASHIDEVKKGQAVQVVARDPSGILQSKIVQLDEKGKGTAVFSFEKIPGALSIALGPENVSREEMFGLQTINLSVSARQWKNLKELHLPWVIISPYYWHWWLRWCRTFTIRGRVLCKDGSPVPGAVVCAYDVDWFWWWRSTDKVGCATTDANGSFEIRFRWCCGWWPWWWWRFRRWELDPDLYDRIRHLYYQAGPWPPIPLPDPEPSLGIFKHILGEQEYGSMNLKPKTAPVEGMKELRSNIATVSPVVKIDQDMLDPLRKKLFNKFPVPRGLERLKLWPWWPWHPWSDCTPDIIFRVTQNCNGADHVIVNENILDTRWDIPAALNVTLYANEEACCIAHEEDEPDGTCALLMGACDDPINNIGGNGGPVATPVGYVNPGVVENHGDRPYAENVFIQGQMGSDVDYYAFEYSTDNGANWDDLPTSAVGNFSREYWDPGPNIFTYVSFLKLINGKMVFETRRHFEDTHDPLTWGHSRYWMFYNYFGLMNWLTRTPFLNGDYQLRVRGWNTADLYLGKPGTLLNTCNRKEVALLKLHIDNRTVFSPPPVTPPVCGPGTVHLCTSEPDSDFISVKIIHYDPIEQVMFEETLDACGTSKPITENDKVRIEFKAHDPKGHLEDYTLHSNYRENLMVDILALGTPTEVSNPLLPAGPDYKKALGQGAVSPHWYGGTYQITVPAKSVFPETCCYQLELYVRKRNIVNCDDSYWGYYNLSQYQITVNVK